MSDDSSSKGCATTIIGMIIMVGGFFGGFMQFFWIDTHNVGLILFYVLVVPMISFLVGAGVIIYGMRKRVGTTGAFGLAMNPRMLAASKEKSYVYQPPRFCSDCGAALTSEGIEWVGPLTIKCPYCGATQPAEKREI
jgi:DNA-directed RNA polymerase subunit RPC12/RpoP